MDDTASAVASPPRQRPSPDLWLVAALTLATFVVASRFEIQELLTGRLARLERWQLDEVPLTLTVLACGLAWYAFRRRREVESELALRVAAEARSAALLVRNRELAHRLISLQESERLALARELHDELGQNCAAIRVEAAFLRRVAPDDRHGMLAAAQRTDAAASDLYRVLGDLLRRLRPANLDALGLVAAIEELCGAWQERTGIVCAVRASGSTERFGNAIDIAIYRVVQEALTNVARHAGASRVDVELASDRGEGIVLVVADDGCGVDLDVARQGLGLLGATERIASVEGMTRLTSRPGQGFRIDAVIPWATECGGAIASPSPLGEVYGELRAATP